MSCFICIISSYLSIFLVFLFSPNIFWFNLSSCILCTKCVAFLFSSHILVFFFCLSIFACCRRFFIRVSTLISHPGVEVVFVFFKWTPIFSLANFTRHCLFRLILWFYSLRYVFIIRFLYSVSILTVFQSSFQKDGNAVFFFDCILNIVCSLIVFLVLAFFPLFLCVVFWLLLHSVQSG